MPRYVLPGISANPLLPVRPVRGFFDDFNRPNSASLGRTSGEYKPWVHTGGVTVGRIVNGRAVAGETGGSGFEFVDANTADGTLRVVMGGVTNPGTTLILVRATNGQNGLRLVPTATGYKFQSLVAGVSTELASIGGTIAVGDVIDVTLSGTAGRIRVNNGSPVNFTDSTFPSNTMVGFGWVAASGIAFESVQFQPFN